FRSVRGRPGRGAPGRPFSSCRSSVADARGLRRDGHEERLRAGRERERTAGDRAQHAGILIDRESRDRAAALVGGVAELAARINRDELRLAVGAGVKWATRQCGELARALIDGEPIHPGTTGAGARNVGVLARRVDIHESGPDSDRVWTAGHFREPAVGVDRKYVDRAVGAAGRQRNEEGGAARVDRQILRTSIRQDRWYGEWGQRARAGVYGVG